MMAGEHLFFIACLLYRQLALTKIWTLIDF